ncbi:hypothetical protein AB1N83_008397 [Pleurotus pulmonarius]
MFRMSRLIEWWKLGSRDGRCERLDSRPPADPQFYSIPSPDCQTNASQYVEPGLVTRSRLGLGSDADAWETLDSWGGDRDRALSVPSHPIPYHPILYHPNPRLRLEYRSIIKSKTVHAL